MKAAGAVILTLLSMSVMSVISVCPPGTKTDDPQGRCCVLPFSYGEETFDACTLTGETRLWCSLDAVYAGNYAYCVTPCSSNPCQNGGTCVENGNSFSCICKDDFTGDTCSEDVKDERPWHQLNTSPVCFSATGSQYGTFKMPSGDNLQLIKLKLEHLHGYVSCYKPSVPNWSPWGCSYGFQKPDYVFVAITNTGNEILLPPSELQVGPTDARFFIPGYPSQGHELVLSVFKNPLVVQSEQEMRLWYTEDLLDFYNGDDGGRVCCDVYAQFI